MYEWDENKNRLNLEKHGISFSLATEVFSDEMAITQFNQEKNGELRSQIIGSVAGAVVILFVVFTERNTKIRIISARKASKKERLAYENKKRTNRISEKSAR